MKNLQFILLFLHIWTFIFYHFRLKLELWVTSLSDTPRLQYYDVQTLEYSYISKLIISPSKF
jgi:hypothetical protein